MIIFTTDDYMDVIGRIESGTEIEAQSTQRYEEYLVEMRRFVNVLMEEIPQQIYKTSF
jgi:hypothetical protein